MLLSYDTDLITVVFRTLKSLQMAVHSSEDKTISTKLFYMKFLAICIEYMFYKQPN